MPIFTTSEGEQQLREHCEITKTTLLLIGCICNFVHSYHTHSRTSLLESDTSSIGPIDRLMVMIIDENVTNCVSRVAFAL